MSLGYSDFNCVCCCKCPWDVIEISAEWDVTSSSEEGCVFTMSASGTVTKTLTLDKDGCVSANEYNEPNGSGSVTVTEGCDKGSGPLDITLISVDFAWDCESKTGTCAISLHLELPGSGSPGPVSLTYIIDIEGTGAGPFLDAQGDDNYSASVSMTIDHHP